MKPLRKAALSDGDPMQGVCQINRVQVARRDRSDRPLAEANREIYRLLKEGIQLSLTSENKRDENVATQRAGADVPDVGKNCEKAEKGAEQTLSFRAPYAVEVTWRTEDWHYTAKR